MGVITGSNTIDFISTNNLFSKIKRDFKSFASANLIDDGDFPVYTVEVLNTLGISSLKESEDVLDIVDCKTPVPKGLVEIHAIYKCTPCERSTILNSQGAQTIIQDVTCEVVGIKNDCNITCESKEGFVQKVTTEMKIGDSQQRRDYINPVLLRLSPNVKSKCSVDCMNMLSTAPFEITINDNMFYTNFDNDSLYIQYYGIPLDCDGYPMIPNNHHVIKAIEMYIKYQILLGFWYSGDIADISNKWQKAEKDYLEALAEARYILKLPSFASIINQARHNRTVNKVNFFNP